VASIQTRPRKDGATSYRVVWRDADDGLRSRTYTDKDKAVELKDFLDANGNSFKVAAVAKIRKDSTAPTVSEVVKRHIDLLRKPQPGTIAKYRRMVAAHIDGSELGKTPVDKVTKADVIDWLHGPIAGEPRNRPSTIAQDEGQHPRRAVGSVRNRHRQRGDGPQPCQGCS